MAWAMWEGVTPSMLAACEQPQRLQLQVSRETLSPAITGRRVGQEAPMIEGRSA
jgi:hypothetical protein